MNILSVDPGAVHCGTAFVSNNNISFKELSPSELLHALETKKIDIVIVEEYVIYSWTAQLHFFKTLEVVELIGKIKYICEKRNIKVVTQQASIKNFIRKSKPDKLSKVKNKHCRDAYAHYLFYKEKIGKESRLSDFPCSAGKEEQKRVK